MPGTSRLVPPGIVCTSASAPAATATTAPMPAILKNCRLVAAFEAAVAGRAIGCAAPDEPALGFSAVDHADDELSARPVVSSTGAASTGSVTPGTSCRRKTATRK